MNVIDPRTRDTSSYRWIMLILTRAANLFSVVRTIRGPLAVAVGASLVLSLPPQTRELYRALAEAPFRNLWHFFIALALLCVTAVSFLVMARELLRTRGASGNSFAKSLPLICACCVPAGFLVGFCLSASDMNMGRIPATKLASIPGLKEIKDTLEASRLALFTGSAVCGCVLLAFGLMQLRRHRRDKRDASRFDAIKIRHIAMLGIFALGFFFLFPVEGSQFVGTLGVLLLGVTGFGALTSLLTKIGDRYNLPLFSGVVVVAVAMSLLGWADNHRIVLRDSKAARLQSPRSAFKTWYKHRADRAYYEKAGIPYPVFIVTAAGGGLYAAQHAATVLARMQDRCPNFAQHVFAISGVSGGSLGAALFSALAEVHAKNGSHVDCAEDSGAVNEKGPIELEAEKFLDTDFLSPIVASALFSDGLQRLVPLGLRDRSVALEDTIRQAWTKVSAGRNPWSTPFLEHWEPSGAAPALMLNSTMVEHGERVVITPFEIIDWDEVGNIPALSNLSEFHTLTMLRSDEKSPVKMRDVDLATAVSLSSRFPWVLPAGRLELQDRWVRLVDGGYFENSGADTAYDLLQSLWPFYWKPKSEGPQRIYPLVRIRIIAISNLAVLEDDPSFRGLEETLSPIRTMLSTRNKRAVGALMRMYTFSEDFCSRSIECDGRVDVQSFYLDLYDFNLALGWLLAPSTRSIIGLHIGTASRGREYYGNPDEPDRFERIRFYVHNSDQSACRIAAVLSLTHRDCGL